MSLIPFVVERCEGEDIKEEKGRTDSHSNAKFRRVIARIKGEQVLVRAVGSFWFQIRGEGGVRVARGAGAGCSGPSAGARAGARTCRGSSGGGEQLFV